MAFIVDFISSDGWDLLGYAIIALGLLVVSVLVQQVLLIFIYALRKRRWHFPFVYCTTMAILMVLTYFFWVFVMWRTNNIVTEMMFSQPEPLDPAIVAMQNNVPSPFLGGHMFFLLPALLQVPVIILRRRRGKREKIDIS